MTTPTTPTTSTRIDLHLRVRVQPGRRDEFLAFLREAIPFYESPGGIEVRLLEDLHDDHRFIELVLYENREVYERDQRRVEGDPEMGRWLARWRELLAAPPTVEVYGLRSPV
ncbi:MAG: antibiotic biosynthesis monooxygenase [Phycisphaerales bacterium]|nr:antibiotic biosynthesis monooxygenase [Phycisphaerales bacterium]